MSLIDAGPNTIRVLLVDDCPCMRTALAALLSQDQRIEVIGVALDGAQALELVEVLCPDVVVTDLEMPKMHGADFVVQQMSRRFVPIIVFSGLKRSDPLAERALVGGAVDFLQKPAKFADVFTQQERLQQKIVGAVGRVIEQPVASE